MPTGLRWPSPHCPACFVPICAPEDSTGDGERSYSNLAQVSAAVAVVEAAMRHGDLLANQIGVITPYAAQVQSIREAIQAVAPGVEVCTVDGFQGREKDLIVLSTVRSNSAMQAGFVADARRLNVAITRARRGLVVIGDPKTLGTSSVWHSFIRWFSVNNCFVDSLIELLPKPDHEAKMQSVSVEMSERSDPNEKMKRSKSK